MPELLYFPLQLLQISIQMITRRSLANVGAQVDFRFIMFFHLKMTFSVGYAMAFEKNQSRSDEIMFSLKIL